MNPSIIDTFIATCRRQGEKDAIISQNRRISFHQLLSDLYRTAALIRAKGLQPGDKALILVPPSYEFYLLMLAGIYCGIDLVAMDSYKNIRAVRAVMGENRISYVFCNSATAILKPLLGKSRLINVEAYTRFSDAPTPHETDPNRTVLTTFTSGTTGNPKPIFRSIRDFAEQITIISANIPIDPDAIVYSKLPVYVLFILFSGLTCVISGKIEADYLKNTGVRVMLAPIAQLLAVQFPMPFIQRVAIGGAMLYEREARQLIDTFPNADITYIYGSSECVLMAKAELREFVHTGALDADISGIQLSLKQTDGNGVGQVSVKGNVVLTDSKEHISSDLGFLDCDGLHIVGRKDFSDEGKYNYLLDAEILSENPRVNRGFSIVKDGNIHFCYEGILSITQPEIHYRRFSKLPMDAKHKTKLNYHKALKKLH